MSKIKPKQIPQQLVYIYSPDGEVYVLNELEIDKNGEAIKWPDGLFCEDFKLLTELMKLGLKKRMLQCPCGGTFEVVQSNLPYNDTHFQCNQCDGTKV